MMDISAGLFAGFAATLILSLMMLAKKTLDIRPRLDMIGMLGRAIDRPRPADWIIHTVVGTFVYGIAFALLAGTIDGEYWVIGLVLGAIGWILAGLFFMPKAGKGLFGLKIGPAALLMSMAMHLLFGALLGWFYSLMVPGYSA